MVEYKRLCRTIFAIACIHTSQYYQPPMQVIPKLRHQHQDLVQLCAAALPDINKDGGCCSFTEILDHQNTSEYMVISCHIIQIWSCTQCTHNWDLPIFRLVRWPQQCALAESLAIAWRIQLENISNWLMLCENSCATFQVQMLPPACSQEGCALKPSQTRSNIVLHSKSLKNGVPKGPKVSNDLIEPHTKHPLDPVEENLCRSTPRLLQDVVGPHQHPPASQMG